MHYADQSISGAHKRRAQYKMQFWNTGLLWDRLKSTWKGRRWLQKPQGIPAAAAQPEQPMTSTSGQQESHLQGTIKRRH